MNKFTIAPIENEETINQNNPILYKVWIGNKYYLHKGKVLRDSLNKLLDDVFRGIRGKNCSDMYINFVEYCNKYPSAHRVMIELVLNAEPTKILAMESKLFKQFKNDMETLNRVDIEPYKPEWMLKAKFQAKCEKCIVIGISEGKKIKFRFCPLCGKVN